MIENVRQAVQNANLYTYLGKIDKIVGTTVEAMGPACKIGDVCTIDVPGDNPPVKAEVVGFRENRVLLMPYEETEGIGYGSAVRNTGERLLIPVSNELIGRTVDAMGIPIDGQGPLREVAYYPITGKRSNPMERPRIDTVIQMGVKAIDGLLTIGKGQRMGIFAGSGVGKSTLMGMIAKNVKADVNVIALVGERSREVVEFINRDLGEEGLKRSVLVVATSNQSAMMRSKCTMTATTIAEYFKDQGMDVLLMMDSLTRFAMAQREVGLSIGEPPVARATRLPFTRSFRSCWSAQVILRQAPLLESIRFWWKATTPMNRCPIQCVALSTAISCCRERWRRRTGIRPLTSYPASAV